MKRVDEDRSSDEPDGSGDDPTVNLEEEENKQKQDNGEVHPV